MTTSLHKVFLLTSIGAAGALAAPMYTITNLGTLGGSSVVGLGINSTGRVTGYSFTAGNATAHAFLYDGTMHDLGSLGGSTSHGLGINSGGKVVGDSKITGGGSFVFHAFLYD